MTPSEDERARTITGLVSAVAALQAGEQHAARDIESVRREIRESEARLTAKVLEVDAQCAERFKAAAEGFNASLSSLRTDLKDDRSGRRGVTVAWIGGAFVLLASIANAITSLLGGGP